MRQIICDMWVVQTQIVYMSHESHVYMGNETHVLFMNHETYKVHTCTKQIWVKIPTHIYSIYESWTAFVYESWNPYFMYEPRNI